jgi:predicted RNase H-like HicB family nuclease
MPKNNKIKAKTNITISISRTLHKRIKCYAEKLGISISDYLDGIIPAYDVKEVKVRVLDHDFTVVIETNWIDGGFYAGCVELSEVVGYGRTEEECLVDTKGEIERIGELMEGIKRG